MGKLQINLRRAARWAASALLAPTLPYGGQAAIEGVMMKGTEMAALAVRRTDGRIQVLDREAKVRFPALVKLPFVRGFFVLWDMMTLGMWAIRESSKRFESDMLAQEAAEKRQKRIDAGEIPADDTPGEGGDSAPPEEKPLPAWVQGLTIAGSLVIALFIFKVLPAMAASGVFGLVGWEKLSEIPEPTLGQQFLANLIEGLIKLGIFIGYIWLVGRIKEIARVFAYHGAEHIVINAYEHDQDNQDIGFIQSHTTAHPRCGTSFIVILILLSIVLFTVFDWALVSLLPHLVVDNIPVWYLRWPLRILALPVLAGLSYEVIKAAFKFYGKPVITPLLKFGMLFQQLTTRVPDASQIEVSLASFNRARFLTEEIPEPEFPARELIDENAG